MKQIAPVVAIVGTFFIAACSMFAPTNEQVRQEPSKTVYKPADDTINERPNLAPAQKVPGE